MLVLLCDRLFPHRRNERMRIGPRAQYSLKGMNKKYALQFKSRFTNTSIGISVATVTIFTVNSVGPRISISTNPQHLLLSSSHFLVTMATTTRASVAAGSTRRPFVVLIGWLGCQPKHIQRYEKTLYQGFEILTRIPTPAQVIAATLRATSRGAAGAALQPPRTWPYHYKYHSSSWSSSSSSSSSLNDDDTKSQQVDCQRQALDSTTINTAEALAWEILAQMDASDAPVFMIHVFSNGGSFVLEAMVNILAAAAEDSCGDSRHGTEAESRHDAASFSKPVQRRLQSIQARLAGIVVDSAPSLHLHRLPEALRRIPVSELVRTLLGYPSWWYTFWNWTTPAVQQQLQERSKAYANMWSTVLPRQGVPLLFLYSRNDPLAQAVVIDKIVAANPLAVGICWKESLHCAHLLQHAAEYQEGVNRFVQNCLERPCHHTGPSRL